MKRIFICMSLCALLILPAVSVYAENTDFKVRILPKDCIFDVVDSGTQQLIFYTPEACGQPIDPENPPVDPLPPDEKQELFPVASNDIAQKAASPSEEDLKKVDTTLKGKESSILAFDFVVKGKHIPWLLIASIFFASIIGTWFVLDRKRK